jgi:hypothetical protein
MNVLVLIDEVVCNDQSTLISFDFVRQCDYLEFANHFGLEKINYEDITVESPVRGSFVQLENYRPPIPLKQDGYYLLNMDILNKMELKPSDDSLLYMAAFYCDGGFSEESEPLFVSYTGFPYWLWPAMRADWGFSSEELTILKSGQYELAAACHKVLDNKNSKLLVIPCWDKENISLVLQKSRDEISGYDIVLCVSAYLSHSVFSLLCWLGKVLPEGRVQIIHNNLADPNSSEARLIHQNSRFSLSVSPLKKNRRECELKMIYFS